MGLEPINLKILVQDVSMLVFCFVIADCWMTTEMHTFLDSSFRKKQSMLNRAT